jgi:hypothetical protein
MIEPSPIERFIDHDLCLAKNLCGGMNVEEGVSICILLLDREVDVNPTIVTCCFVVKVRTSVKILNPSVWTDSGYLLDVLVKVLENMEIDCLVLAQVLRNLGINLVPMLTDIGQEEILERAQVLIESLGIFDATLQAHVDRIVNSMVVEVILVIHLTDVFRTANPLTDFGGRTIGSTTIVLTFAFTQEFVEVFSHRK